MSQMGFAAMEFAAKKQQMRRERFLGKIEAAKPWAVLIRPIEPFYPKGQRGPPPIGIERMLRKYAVPQCYRLSGEGTEGTLHDRQSLRTIVGIDLNREAVPDSTTLLHFRRLLEMSPSRKFGPLKSGGLRAH